VKRWLKEPLLHFLIAGGLLFVIFKVVNRGRETGDASAGSHVRIGEADVQWLEETWARQWQRTPSKDELQGLVRDYLKEELLSREAKSMGLDQNDTIVRRRLAQKMEFMIQDTVSAAAPTEAELLQLYNSNPVIFQVPARLSFKQIFFNPEKPGTPAAERAAKALEQLTKPEGPADPGEFGDSMLLEREFFGEEESSISNLFGKDFAKKLFELEPGKWRGPIESTYGLHLILITEKQAARARDFAKSRDRVLGEWQRRRQQTENEKYFAALLKKYNVTLHEKVESIVGPLDGKLSERPQNSGGDRPR